MPKAELILGPILGHLSDIGLDSGHVQLITAFYSGRALSSLEINAPEVTVACRLDMSSIEDWGRGYVAPDKLLVFLDSLRAAGKRVHLFASPTAHAKLYLGSSGVLVGSANLTLAGFGGGEEILTFLSGQGDVKRAREIARSYTGILTPVSLEELTDYVRRNRAAAERLRASQPGLDRLPTASRSSRRHLGSYDDFLGWLARRRSTGSAEILARAKGKSNLSGHIHRNFFGLRQFLIAYPEIQRVMLRQPPEAYKLSRDTKMEQLMAEFVSERAIDEDHFRVDTWRTYLPIECGGRAGRHGGTIGNLNFMLPLVALYLDRVR